MIMDIETTNKIGKIAFSLQAVADLAGDTVTAVYGVVGLVDKKKITKPIVEFLKQGDYADGVSVKKNKTGYDVSLYLVLSKDVRIAEVVCEVQKQVSYILGKSFGIPFKVVNVYVQAVR